MKNLLSIVSAAAFAGFITNPVNARTMNMSCQHTEGSYKAVVEFRPNSYPTPDVLVHGQGFTIEFDHVPGSEVYRTSDGSTHTITGRNELNFKDDFGRGMTCRPR